MKDQRDGFGYSVLDLLLRVNREGLPYPRKRVRRDASPTMDVHNELAQAEIVLRALSSYVDSTLVRRANHSGFFYAGSIAPGFCRSYNSCPIQASRGGKSLTLRF
jgi:hypothetical protein